jgi:hypothetical protein
MTTATARYIWNGYIVTWSGTSGGSGLVVPPSVYALSVPEVMYWIARIFDPVANPSTTFKAAPERERTPAPSIIEPPDDPLLGQQAQVIDVASGGFLVTQMPSIAGAQFVEVYCADLDTVHAMLAQIFTQPAPPPLEEQAPGDRDPVLRRARAGAR